MLNFKNRLSTKLFLFVLIISLILIGGSFTYFYYFGKSYITEVSSKEIFNYSKSFEQAALSQINQSANVIFTLSVNTFNSENIEKKLLNNAKNILRSNSNAIDAIYLEYGNPLNSIALMPTTVLFGKQIINVNKLELAQFDSLYNMISISTISKNGVEFGSIRDKYQLNYYLRRTNSQFKIVVKLSCLQFYEKLLNRIYFSDKINFCIVNNKNNIVYSSNIHWINQRAEKYFSGKSIGKNLFEDNEKKIIYKTWSCSILSCRIIVSNNYELLYGSFLSLLNNIFIYSITLYLFIVIIALFYSNRISKSLNRITSVTKQVAERNFDNRIEIVRNDEIGILINSFNNMISELEVSYNKLNVTNRELTRKLKELKETRIELSKKEKLALVGETVSKISHEIQNKISGVSIWVQNLEIQSSNNENISLYVKEIKNALNSFMKMLQNFKKFYRKPYLEKLKIDFVQAVNNVIEKYNSDIQEKGIVLKKDFSSTKIILTLDINLIEEVIENLLTNAIYFSSENSRLQIKMFTENSNVVFIICNEGVTVPEDNYDTIFHPFFTTKSSGSGLGLAIAKNIIDAHKGTIELIKNYKEGTCFKVELPII